MARGRKKQHGQGRVSGRHVENNDRGQRPGNRSAPQKSYGDGDDKGSGTSNKTSFSLRDEARNTEQHHTWNSDRKLRHTQVNFVSAAGAEPEISKAFQASTPEATHKAESHILPPQSSLASMTIKEQDNICPGIPPSDERSCTNNPAVILVQSNPETDQDPRHSVDNMFFIDEIGSPVAIRKKLVPPNLPQSSSPSPSGSSEEVIVFGGRQRAPQKSLEPRITTVGDSSIEDDEDSHSPLTDGELNPDILGTAHAAHSSAATPHQIQQSGLQNPNNLDTTYSGIDQSGPSKEPLPYLTRKSFRSGRRKSQRANKRARLAAEDEDILADYIEHMNDEENLNLAFCSLVDNAELLDEFSTDIESQDNKNANTIEFNTHRPLAGKPSRDLSVTRSVDEALDLTVSTGEDSDGSIDDEQISADLHEYMDDIEDECDLLERKQARKIDEHIARLLSKQEELGLDSTELLLFDGNGNGKDPDQASEEDEGDVLFQSASGKRRRTKKRRPQHHSTDAFPSAMELGDMLDQDPYGDFDLMDHHRPSLKRAPGSRRSVPVFELSDIELEASMQLAWEKDRSKKKLKKKERERLSAQGLLGNNGQADLKAKYREGISFGEIKDELIDFMLSARQSLALPPMANNERRMVHEMAHVLRLKSKSSGQGKARFPVLYKTGRTEDLGKAAINQLEALFSSRRFLPRKDVKGHRRTKDMRPGRCNAGNPSGVSYQDGEVVGAAAPEIGEENRGRAILEKMGWSKGTALGALNNKGMLQPVVHTVKISKAGLG